MCNFDPAGFLFTVPHSFAPSPTLQGVIMQCGLLTSHLLSDTVDPGVYYIYNYDVICRLRYSSAYKACASGSCEN